MFPSFSLEGVLLEGVLLEGCHHLRVRAWMAGVCLERCLLIRCSSRSRRMNSLPFLVHASRIGAARGHPLSS